MNTIRKEYRSEPLNSEELFQVGAIREAFSELSEVLDKICINGRYKSLANTALEQASMWAIKSVSHKA